MVLGGRSGTSEAHSRQSAKGADAHRRQLRWRRVALPVVTIAIVGTVILSLDAGVSKQAAVQPQQRPRSLAEPAAVQTSPAAMHAAVSRSSDNTIDLASCLWDPSAAPAPPFTKEDFWESHPSSLKLEVELRSQQPRSERAVSMLATSDIGRLHLLEDLCKSWFSVMTVAIYVSTLPGEGHERVSEAQSTVRHAFERLEALEACQPDLALYSEVVADEIAAALFPVNNLRNLAILAARTPLVLMANIDMLIGRSLTKFLQSSKGYADIAHLVDSDTMVLVAAFESDDMDVVRDAAAGGKQAVRHFVRERKLRYFHKKSSPTGQSSLKYRSWLRAKHPYQLKRIRVEFEPWFIMQRARVGCYDERFRARGKNKVQHVQMLVRQYNYSCVVHPKAYMVHRPHPPSPALESFKKANIYRTVEGWFSQQLTEGRNRSVLVVPSWQRCQRQLPWWQDLWNDDLSQSTANSLDMCHHRQWCEGQGSTELSSS